ncbi:MAG: helix-turn-helix transcriptional regulator [Caldilineaceae bacterium]|nr:helix-turn-helix transcriptional regulator [Caldilineaceae bacterium]
MTTRSYHQLCGLAFALDLVGERWTLLIIRELIAGPRRFTDLLEGLPGISTNLLTERLKHLEEQQLIQRRILPPPAASAVYELTTMGRALEASLLELGRWGSQFVPASPEGCHILPLGSYALTPKTFFRAECAQALDETYVLYIGDEVQQVHITHGQIDVRQGEPVHADMALHTEMSIYLGLLTRQIDPAMALSHGLVQVKGDQALFYRFFDLCSMPTQA